MRAVVVRQHGGIDQLELATAPVPELPPDGALIRVKAAGINHLDLWVRRGVETHKFPFPMIPGSDFAGELVALGPLVKGWTLGQRVTVCPSFGCYQCDFCLAGEQHICRYFGVYGETRDGGDAEYVQVHGANLLPVPDHLSYEEAAAIPLTLLTVHHMLRYRARLESWETILIHAAGSGVGTMAIQLAKLLGAKVIATASTDAKLAKARELGADYTINYSTADWVNEVRSLTGKAGVPVALDMVGAPTFAGSIHSLAKGGRLVTCGATAGPLVDIDLRPIYFKSLSILGSTMGGVGEMRRIWTLVERGQIKPTIDRVLPITEIRQAHAAVEERQQFGKVILTMDWGGT